MKHLKYVMYAESKFSVSKMNKRVSRFIVILSIMLVLFLNSCSDDDKVSTGFYTMLATVEPISEKEYYLVLDNGETLYPSSMAGYTPKDNQRVYVDFTLLENKNTDYDYYARINAIQNITTGNVTVVTTEEENIQVGDDPIKIQALWFGDGYLNFRITFKRDVKSHMISLVHNNLADYPNDGKVHLELRHNAFEDNMYHEVTSFVAYNMRSITEVPGSVETINFVIHVKDLGESAKTYDITYKKHDVNTSNTGSLSDFTSTTYNSDLDFGITF